MREVSRPLRLASGVILKEDKTRDCHFLMIPERLVKLSRTASEILREIDGKQSSMEIIEKLKAKYDTEDIRTDVTNFLKEAMLNGWITYEVDHA